MPLSAMPGAFRTLFTPTTLLGYSTARKVYLLHHRRHPHPAWPVGKQEAEDTIEHIVPQSIYKRDPENRRIRCDMHNFFVLRGKLNGLKSNHPYSTLENTLFDNRLQLIRPDGTHHPLESPEHLSGRSDQVIHAIYRHRCQQTSKMKTVIIPPACLRGIIARSVAYMSTIYYDHADAMYSQVLDINTILRWHHQYPVTKYEYDRNMFIEIIQGNSNPYVKYPEMLPLALKAFDETIDLAFFKDYKYDVYFYGRGTT